MSDTPDTPDSPDPASGLDAAPRDGQRIAKVLSRAGIASRRDAERMIAAGRVAVNGRTIDSPALNVTGADRISVDGQPVAAAEPPRLWLYHKPAGLVTTARDEKGRATIFDDLPAELPRVMPVGRLDLTSEGLLLLTNDGAVKRRLELPATGWLRKYRVRVNGTPDDATLEPLRKGIRAGGESFAPMTVTLDRQQGANAWLTVGLREGRNREIRRAMEAVGLVVNRLIRISYGPFRLGDLPAGGVEEVRRKVLREQLGLAAPDATGTAAVRARPRPAKSRPGGKTGPKPCGAAAGRRKPDSAAGPLAGAPKPQQDEAAPAGASRKPGAGRHDGGRPAAPQHKGAAAPPDGTRTGPGPGGPTRPARRQPDAATAPGGRAPKPRWT